MSHYLSRLRHLRKILKNKPIDFKGIVESLSTKNIAVSTRQINRDLNALEFILEDDEELAHFYTSGKKYFYINTSTNLGTTITKTSQDGIKHSSFYNQKITVEIQTNLDQIQKAIRQRSILEINLIKDDETGDNLELDSKKVKVCPIKLIYHRGTYYLASYNIKLKTVEVYGVRQLQDLVLGNVCKSFSKFESKVESELKSRFGVSKNINATVYDIEIKFTPALGRFIENHHWHHSQKITKEGAEYVLRLHCGINRELVGWLFQWMYNVKVVKPANLKKLYNTTINETKSTSENKTHFVYRNIFTEN